MVDIVELQHASLLSSRLERYKVKSTNPYRINFRCPICLDSQKSKSKTRGWLLEDKTQHFHFFCHNCGASHSFSNFLKLVDLSVYNDFIASKYIKKAIQTETEIDETQFITKVKFDDSHLKKLKKISQLAIDHPVKQYIEKRQIPSNQHYRLYYAPKFMTWVNSILPGKFKVEGKDHPRLIIPFLDENKHMFGCSARGFDPNGLRYITIMFEEKQKIFGLDTVDFSNRYKIVEGAIDSLFVSNAIAMAGADGNIGELPRKENAVFVFDNEPRNAEIHKRMSKIIDNGLKLCIWPSYIKEKDINDMYLAGIQNIDKIIEINTYSGLSARLKLAEWRKT